MSMGPSLGIGALRWDKHIVKIYEILEKIFLWTLIHYSRVRRSCFRAGSILKKTGKMHLFFDFFTPLPCTFEENLNASL